MSSIAIHCPVKGTWSFLNPPGHHPDAKDFVAVDVRGKPYKPINIARHLFWRLNVSKVLAWEKQVLAPFNAVIVDTESACQDRKSLNFVRDVIAGLLLAKKHDMDETKFFLGNHVIMQSDSGIYALFAHLRKGSVRVNNGDRVKSGDLIAAIGNSGNTIQPHLHFQLMIENSPFTSPPIPFVFSTYETKVGKAWKQQSNSLPANGQVFRVSG